MLIRAPPELRDDCHQIAARLRPVRAIIRAADDRLTLTFAFSEKRSAEVVQCLIIKSSIPVSFGTVRL